MLTCMDDVNEGNDLLSSDSSLIDNYRGSSRGFLRVPKTIRELRCESFEVHNSLGADVVMADYM